MADQTLQEIKDRLNVADVISSYIPIKKAGGAFKAVCPFHNEKTPSLMISPAKQIWHCFGCGEGGVKLPEYRPQDPKLQSEQDLLLRINNFAARFYHEGLLQPVGRNALEYLKNRGLNEGTIKQWQIGYAPDDYHSLEKALASKGVKQEDLVKAGVSVKNERGQIYDRFRGRITFPIVNYFGDVVGFSARILTDDGKSAKYINSPETAIYNKSKVLFGLYFGKNEIRKKDDAVVVEGQMDCISLHQSGFSNVVASSGTALTNDQLQMLGRLTKNLKFCFDQDTAGQIASRRAGELALKQGFRLKVIQLKAVKDPDELVKKSPGLWEKAVKEAQWFLDQQIEAITQMQVDDEVDRLHHVTQQVLPLIGFIQDPLERDHYIKKIAEQFNVTEKTIREQIKMQGLDVSAEAGKISGKQPNFGLEKEILGAVLVFADFSEKVLLEAKPDEFESSEIKEVLRPLWDGKAGRIDRASTLSQEAVFMVESELEELQGNEPALKRQLEKSFALFKVQAVKRLQITLQQQISQAEKSGDKERLAALNQQFADFSEKRMEYEKKM